jgi:uncharacterized integral membrane protein
MARLRRATAGASLLAYDGTNRGASRPHHSTRERIVTFVWLALAVGLAVLASLFGAQNRASVDLVVFGTTLADVTLWRVVLIPAVGGVLLGFLLAMPGRVQDAVIRRRLLHKARDLAVTIDVLQQRNVALERQPGRGPGRCLDGGVGDRHGRT